MKADTGGYREVRVMYNFVINISDPDPWPRSIPIREEHVLKPRSFSTSTPPHTGLLFIFPQPRTCMLSFPRNAWVFCQHHDERISYFLGDVEKRQIGQ